MTPQEIKAILASGDIEKIQGLFKDSKTIDTESQIKIIKQYKVKDHDIFSTSIRPDKEIIKDLGENTADGTRKTQKTTSPVARIGLPKQKTIVKRRVGFMLSDPVTLEVIYEDKGNDKEKSLVSMVERIQNDNKMDYKNKEIARRLMSELEVAELWYFVPTNQAKPKFTLKIQILSPDLGDVLYPLFDTSGDMVAFSRAYKIKDNNKEVEHFDIYTPEFEYKYINKDNTWKLDDEVVTYTIEGEKKLNPIPNPVNKVMIIYHTQPEPEWADVQTMIDRQEVVISNHADMNDYFGSPILTVAGDILGFAAKGEQGKILQLAQEAKANFLALNAPPESFKMEIENLDRFIYEMSQTPNISFEQMKTLAGNISGIALKLMFLDAHIAVKDKEEIFGIGLQRRINLIKACIGTVIDTSLKEISNTLQIKPVITPYLPQNVTEEIDNLTVAKTGGIISTETAIELNPLVTDTATEMMRIKDDQVGETAGLKV